MKEGEKGEGESAGREGGSEKQCEAVRQASPHSEGEVSLPCCHRQ